MTALLFPRLAAVLPLAGLLLVAPSAQAASTFFGEDPTAFSGTPPLSIPNAAAAESQFLGQLLDAATDDFSAFRSGDEDPLTLAFGTLTDPTSDGSGFVATAQRPKTGFPISGATYWKNTTEDDEGLFTVSFDQAVQAFGFYATGYSTLSRAGGTVLVLRLSLAGGGILDVEIPHAQTTSVGKAFYFGVIAEPFVAATLLDLGERDGDVIGFDDFTAATGVVPEPATALLLASSLAVFAAARRRVGARPRAARLDPSRLRPRGDAPGR